MTGTQTAATPRAPADGPAWAIRLAQDIVIWVEAIRCGPQTLTVYSMSALPDAPRWRGGLIAISDESGGFTPAYSDGAHWRRTSDGAIVS
jgi:hypothetical protein